MKCENVDFMTAVEILCKNCGMSLPTASDSDELQRKKRERDKIYQILKATTEFYHNNLISNPNSLQAQYLKKRGISDEMIEKCVDMGEISDGYHTFNELYEYRKLYNACLFNEWGKQNLYDVHKSRLHSDGTVPFGNKDYFIVVAELPTGQISNHYHMKDWDLFKIPEKEKSNEYDAHTPQDVTERLKYFLKIL
jgi:hypothetical protein